MLKFSTNKNIVNFVNFYISAIDLQYHDSIETL